MQPCRNVVQHLIPWDTHVVSIQVENAALELSALGTAVHIPLEVDIQMLFPRARPVTEWTWDIIGTPPMRRLWDGQQGKYIGHLIAKFHGTLLSG